jgi:TM2 domain-containing membrane protein YozV
MEGLKDEANGFSTQSCALLGISGLHRFAANQNAAFIRFLKACDEVKQG